MNNNNTEFHECGVLKYGLVAAATGVAMMVGAVTASTALSASKIAALVNNVPITTNDISRRAAFFKLRRMKGNHRKLAKEELINEALQMQEAKRLRRIVPDKEVDAAYARFAQRNKMPLKVLTRIMSKSGVTVRGFKKYIKAQMSWQAALAFRARAEGRSSPKTGAISMHEKVLGGSGKTKQYTIQQVVFVVPRNKLKSRSAARLREANNFRSRFSGCDSSVQLAANLKDVSVLKRPRVQVSELPPRWKKEIEATPVGKTTRALKTEKGVELLAICKSREVLSKTAVKEGGLFSGTQAQVSALEKKYMAELRKAAKIKNR